ncbi:MAG: hypothetical protein BBJ57_03265 [Desulfobacterales bacterium PC51MH44]|nr:MAG: hypothetical protein BBJ57_03265 [Desulfobacterales bacterium PC51MH44]
MAYIALILCVFMPSIVLAAHFRFAGNIVTPFLLPRLLSHREYPKSVIRQAGTGWFVFSTWLLTTALTVPNALLGDGVDDNLWLMGIIAFAVPIIAVMSLFIAIYYLSVGIFARSKKIKPGFQSIFATDTNLLDLYMKRLIRYTKINISSIVLLIVIIAIEGTAGVEPEGIVVLINVALLITFIITTGRVRNYQVKSAIAMEQSGEDTLTSTLGNPLAMLFMWYYSFALKKKYDLHRKQTQPSNPSSSDVTYQNR